MDMQEPFLHIEAPISRRVAARIVDALVGFAALFISTLAATVVAVSASSVLAVALFVAMLVLVLLYEPVMVRHGGATLGKMMTGLTVISTDTGETPDWGQSFKRWGLPTGLGLLVAPLALLCYLSLLWNRERRGWHDLFAGTSVVRA